MKNINLLFAFLIIIFASGCGNKNTEYKYLENEWRTYENKKYGFGLRYPANWILRDDRSDVIEIKSVEHTGCSSGGPGELEDGEMVLIRIYQSSLGSIEEVKQEKEDQGCRIAEIKKINNKDYLYYEMCPDVCGAYPGYLIINDGNVIDFYSMYWPIENNTTHYFERIINSVSF